MICRENIVIFSPKKIKIKGVLLFSSFKFGWGWGTKKESSMYFTFFGGYIITNDNYHFLYI